MTNKLDLPTTLQLRFNDHQRELKRQLQNIEKEDAETQKGDPARAQKMAELSRCILRAERHQHTELMVRRKGTFGEALCPICPVCLIDHDKTSLLEECGNRFKCKKCGLVVEAES